MWPCYGWVKQLWIGFLIGGCLVFDEPDLIDTPRSFPITSGPLSQLFILCCIENIERCEISFAFWRLGGGFKIYCDTWGGVWGRTNGHLGATTPTPCVVIIVIFVIIVITINLVIIIIIIRYFNWLLNIIFFWQITKSQREYRICCFVSFKVKICPTKLFSTTSLWKPTTVICVCVCVC